MSFRVVIHESAREGIAEAYRWIESRSHEAAARWLEGLERTIRSLDTFPNRCAKAPESEVVGFEVRQQLYGRRGGKYRILFVVRGDTVHVIEVRHGARRVLGPRELQLPPAAEE